MEDKTFRLACTKLALGFESSNGSALDDLSIGNANRIEATKAKLVWKDGNRDTEHETFLWADVLRFDFSNEVALFLEGSVRVERQGRVLRCDSMKMNPKTKDFVLTGSPRISVTPRGQAKVDDAKPIRIRGGASRVVIEGNSGNVIATGGVVVTVRDVRLRCERAIVRPDDMIIFEKGVVITDDSGKRKAKGSRAFVLISGKKLFMEGPASHANAGKEALTAEKGEKIELSFEGQASLVKMRRPGNELVE